MAYLQSQGTAQLLELNWYPGTAALTEGDELDHLSFRVEDADRQFDRLRDLGWKSALEPFDEGSSRLAYVAEENGLWVQLQSSREPKLLPASPPYFEYTGIRVWDIARSYASYNRHFYMKRLWSGKVPETGGEILGMVDEQSTEYLELNWYPDIAYRNGDEIDHVAFETTNCVDAYKHLLRKVVTAAKEPFREGKWMLAYVKDPDGIWIEVGSVALKVVA